MADPREQILARVVDVAKTVDPSITKAYRNDPSLSEADAPFIMVVDGDEEASDGDPAGRDALTPRHVTMTLAVSFIVSDDPATLGTKMNALRAELIKAVLSDATLLGFTVNGKSIRYAGTDTAVVQGQDGIIGQIDVSFAFTYIMRPDRLT
jgi:hypothetical protein